MKKSKPMFVLGLATFVVSLGYSLVLPAMPYYMDTFGAGGRELGWLTAVYALTQTICAPFWGALSDRVGRKPVVATGMLGYAISLFLFGMASSFWTLFLARSLSGILSSATSAASLAYIGDNASENDRSRNMGQMGAAMSIGTVVGPVIGGFLSGYSLSLPFFVGASVSCVAFILILAMLPESLVRKTKEIQKKAFILSNMRGMLIGQVGTVFVLIFIVSLCQTGLQGITGLYVVDKFSLDASQVGIMWMVVAGVLVLAQAVLLGLLSKWFTEQTLIRAGLSGGALCLFAITLTNGFASVIAVLSLFALTVALTAPTLNASISKFGESNKGALMGLSSTVRNLSKVVGPLMFGYLYETKIELPYLCGAAIALVGVMICQVWMRTPSEGNSV